MLLIVCVCVCIPYSGNEMENLVKWLPLSNNNSFIIKGLKDFRIKGFCDNWNLKFQAEIFILKNIENAEKAKVHSMFNK